MLWRSIYKVGNRTDIILYKIDTLTKKNGEVGAKYNRICSCQHLQTDKNNQYNQGTRARPKINRNVGVVHGGGRGNVTFPRYSSNWLIHDYKTKDLDYVLHIK